MLKSGQSIYRRLLISILLLMLAILSTLVGCKCECKNRSNYYTMSVHITSQPQGGNLVRTLTCSLAGKVYFSFSGNEGDRESAKKDAVVYIYWTTSRGTHKKEQWNPFLNPTFTTTFSAPGNQYLDKTFWVVAQWSDREGFHDLESNKAVCTVK